MAKRLFNVTDHSPRRVRGGISVRISRPKGVKPGERTFIHNASVKLEPGLQMKLPGRLSEHSTTHDAAQEEIIKHGNRFLLVTHHWEPVPFGEEHAEEPDHTDVHGFVKEGSVESHAIDRTYQYTSRLKPISEAEEKKILEMVEKNNSQRWARQ